MPRLPMIILRCFHIMYSFMNKKFSQNLRVANISRRQNCNPTDSNAVSASIVSTRLLFPTQIRHLPFHYTPIPVPTLPPILLRPCVRPLFISFIFNKRQNKPKNEANRISNPLHSAGSFRRSTAGRRRRLACCPAAASRASRRVRRTPARRAGWATRSTRSARCSTPWQRRR